MGVAGASHWGEGEVPLEVEGNPHHGQPPTGQFSLIVVKTDFCCSCGETPPRKIRCVKNFKSQLECDPFLEILYFVWNHIVFHSQCRINQMFLKVYSTSSKCQTINDQYNIGPNVYPRWEKKYRRKIAILQKNFCCFWKPNSASPQEQKINCFF